MGLDDCTKQKLACISYGEGPMGRGFSGESRFATKEDDAEQLAAAIITLGERVQDLERALHVSSRVAQEV